MCGTWPSCDSDSAGFYPRRARHWFPALGIICLIQGQPESSPMSLWCFDVKLPKFCSPSAYLFPPYGYSSRMFHPECIYCASPLFGISGSCPSYCARLLPVCCFSPFMKVLSGQLHPTRSFSFSPPSPEVREQRGLSQPPSL